MFSIRRCVRSGSKDVGLKFLLLLLTSGLLCVSQLAGVAYASGGHPPASNCSLQYSLPGDIEVGSDGVITSDAVAEFAWDTFLALNAPEVGGMISLSGDNTPQWSSWSSTADMLNQRRPGPSGSRFYPAVCKKIKNHQRYRVLQQVGKVNDSLLQASRAGLSNQPVIDRNGNFLRYEILLSPAYYNEVKRRKLYDPLVLRGLRENLNLSCSQASYTGGDPANRKMGSMVIKAAWMEATDLSESELARIHTEKLLVFNPGQEMSTGRDACELTEMALVGAHIVRKTQLESAWVWSTWEHEQNAPDCTAQLLLPKGGPGSATANLACPAQLDRDYHFNSKECGESDACNDCNAEFTVGNTTVPGQCADPNDPDGPAWCLDLPPSPIKGKSQICRQVPVRHGICSLDATIQCFLDEDCAPEAGVCVDNYPASSAWNAACHQAIEEEGDGLSVWSHYELIGTQWFAQESSECENVQASLTTPSGTVNRNSILPQIQLEGSIFDHPNRSSRPFLGNSSMESYIRSNCMGCHASAYLPAYCEDDPSMVCSVSSDCDSGECVEYSSDFQYWLNLEVAARKSFFLDGLYFRGRFSESGKADYLRIRTQQSVDYVPGRSSPDDPRCHEDPAGTIKASFRIFDESGFDSGELGLPCEFWTAMGSKAEGYRYRNPEGLCDHVMIKKDRPLRI
ncbi:MAG: hypothetical protein VX252_06950, partial [Myxococcota bacterium]|nr:hypothetical protein [Myxococcota bacterium]